MTKSDGIESGVRGICVKFAHLQHVRTDDGRDSRRKILSRTNKDMEKTDTIYLESLSRNIGISAICDSIYGELQKSGKHMVMARRKREQK